MFFFSSHAATSIQAYDILLLDLQHDLSPDVPVHALPNPYSYSYLCDLSYIHELIKILAAQILQKNFHLSLKL